MRTQRLIPGIIGFAPATDHVYARVMQRAAQQEGAPGGVNVLRTLTATLDTDAFFALDDDGRTADAGMLVHSAAGALRYGGADVLVDTSNTGSIIFYETGEPELPVLDIFTSAVDAAHVEGCASLGLLGTTRTVESGRYQQAARKVGIDVCSPAPDLTASITEMIDDEAIRGIASEAGLALIHEAVDAFQEHGIEGILLGCTDLMLFGTDSIGRGILPVIDSTRAHAGAAAQLALTGLRSRG
jgi:aspartate racemase